LPRIYTDYHGFSQIVIYFFTSPKRIVRDPASFHARYLNFQNITNTSGGFKGNRLPTKTIVIFFLFFVFFVVDSLEKSFLID